MLGKKKSNFGFPVELNQETIGRESLRKAERDMDRESPLMRAMGGNMASGRALNEPLLSSLESWHKPELDRRFIEQDFARRMSDPDSIIRKREMEGVFIYEQAQGEEITLPYMLKTLKKLHGETHLGQMRHPSPESHLPEVSLEKLLPTVMEGPVPAEVAEAAMADWKEADVEIKRLKKRHDSLLPMEAAARAEVQSRMDTLTKAKAGRLAVGMFGATYLRVSDEIFRLRDRNGRPRVIPFLPANGVFEVHARDMSPHMGIMGQSGAVGRQYRDLLDVYGQVKPWDTFGGMRRVESICYSFGGVIPDAVKSHLPAYEEQFGAGNVLIVADRELCSEKIVTRPIDPLVVGFHPLSETFWLLEKFDTTDFENYLAAEFTE